MRSASEHKAPLRLTTGTDDRLRWGWRVTAAAGVAILCFQSGPLGGRIGLAMATLATWAMVEWRERRRPPQSLLVFPDGTCEIDGAVGALQDGGWITSRYGVVRVTSRQGMRRLLVSAARQAPGEYRKLLAWMRLRPWNPD